jgi:23S rRNA pseudouridine2605 synthase
MERLQKLLARAGIGSRRKCEDYITAGRVTVDGEVVRELGAKADPETSAVCCDGEPIKLQPTVHYLVNKPRGMVCSHAAQGDRPRVFDLFRGFAQRLFTVGRLDMDSEGLLIVTNDGTLAHRLTHPRYGVPRVYEVEVDGVVSRDEVARLKSGIRLSDGRARFDEIEARPVGRGRSRARVVLRQGINREIRRAFAALGHRVRRLRRVQIGRLSDRGLAPGEYRKLSPAELHLLREDAGLERTES